MVFPFLNPPPAIGCGDPGDPIDFSCLFGGGYLTGNPAAGNSLKWTVHFEFKKHEVARTSVSAILSAAITSGASEYFRFDPQDRFELTDGLTSNSLFRTTALFRDPAAHDAITFHYDAANEVAADRARAFRKGVRITGTVNIGLNRQSYINSAVTHALGQAIGTAGIIGTDNRFGGAISRVIFVDGENVDPSAFGYPTRHGSWVCKEFYGPYGATGYHRKFLDPFDLGKDVSDNDNHWASVGLTVNNQVTDTPTNNFATLNPLYADSTKITPSNGNLTAIGNASNPAANNVAGTRIIRHKAFFAMTPVTLGNGSFYIGLQTANGLTYCYRQDGATVLAGAVSAYGAAFAVGDWVGCGYDPATGDVEFFKLVGGAWVSQGILPAAISAADVLPWVYASHQTRVDVNFGQRAWPAELPDGYTGHSTSNMPCPDILNPDDYFTVRLSSGGADVTDLPWNPMVHKTLVVSKRRDAAASWRVSDTVRGNNLAWRCDVGGLEIASSLAFTASGVTVGADTEYQGSRVDYFWRASPKAGFDIIEVDHVTGTPTVVPHLAGGLIDYAWLVPLDGGDVRVFHRALPSGQYLRLNGGSVAGTEANWFASTAVNLTIGASLPTGRYLLPVWRTVPQLSAFVAYGGNSLVDGAFCPLDFLPRMAFIKTSQAPNPHYALDIDRAPGNPITNELQPGTNGVEDTITIDAVDFVSNGLKQRSSTSENNTTPNTIIPVAAWAYTPGKFARAR